MSKIRTFKLAFMILTILIGCEDPFEEDLELEKRQQWEVNGYYIQQSQDTVQNDSNAGN